MVEVGEIVLVLQRVMSVLYKLFHFILIQFHLVLLQQYAPQVITAYKVSFT